MYVKHLMWLLGIELGPPVRTVYTPSLEHASCLLLILFLGFFFNIYILCVFACSCVPQSTHQSHSSSINKWAWGHLYPLNHPASPLILLSIHSLPEIV